MIFHSGKVQSDTMDDAIALSFIELARIAKSRGLFRHILRYRDVSLYTLHFRSFTRPFFVAAVCRLFAKRHCRWIDAGGNTQDIDFIKLLREAVVFLWENLSYINALKHIRQELTVLEEKPERTVKFNTQGTPVYLRTDFTAGFIAGGSVGHIAGVINNMDSYFGEKPVFVSMDTISTIRDDIEVCIIKDGPSYLNVPQLSSIFFSNIFYDSAIKYLEGKNISLVYQRSSLNSYAGVKLSDNLHVPFVLEYNGSEVWCIINWEGRKLKASDISVRIEDVTFKRADLIVCVSKPLQDELLARGVDESKILVNPNGVDETAYHPQIDGSIIRNKYKIKPDDKIVGFIGTFGPWHGAEILAQAFAGSSHSNKNIKLLMIGDGLRMPNVRKILTDSGVLENCIFTGLVPQEEGPLYMAACDILVSPQVPNADGSPFFGSPTKLFEYMAMGKAVAASDLDQIGEVLEHEKTAVLCKSGNTESLQRALLRLVNDEELRVRLGENARKEALCKYTWKLHTKRIIDALKERFEN